MPTFAMGRELPVDHRVETALGALVLPASNSAGVFPPFIGEVHRTGIRKMSRVLQVTRQTANDADQN